MEVNNKLEKLRILFCIKCFFLWYKKIILMIYIVIYLVKNVYILKVVKLGLFSIKY